VQTCELDNLAEYVVLPIPVSIANSSSSLATETEYVRGRLATYVNDLLSLGVDGLRLDAAKREWSI
jgi:glycosidase